MIAPTALPHLRRLCANPKHELRVATGARSLMRASRGAAWMPFASRSTTFDANSVLTVLAPLMPNLAMAPIVKPTVMAVFLLFIISLMTPAGGKVGAVKISWNFPANL